MMDLDAAVEHAYDAFSNYRRGNDIEVCPCCIGQPDQDTLARMPLRDQPGHLLSRFAFKAMSTWGGVDDFKHFLPRIFELMAIGDRDGVLGCEYLPGFDLGVVASKLEYAGWRTWPATEKLAVRQYLDAFGGTYGRHADYKHLAGDLDAAKATLGLG